MNHMTSPLGWMRTPNRHYGLLQCRKMAFGQNERNLVIAYFLVMVSLMPIQLGYHFIATHGITCWCGLVSPSTCSAPSSQHCMRPTPPSLSIYAAGEVWLRHRTQMAQTKPLLHVLKWQVTVTWLGFKIIHQGFPATFELKMSSWTHCKRYQPYWQSPVHRKDRCGSSCQVEAHKSIALYQAGWQTPPCLLSSQASPSLGPQKKTNIHQKSTKSTYQTPAMRTSRLQEDDS